jgi:hypothetical protein
MVVSTKSKSKEATSQTSALTTHTSKKITEMIIVAVIVLLMVSVGLFITQVYGGGDNTVVNNFYESGMSSPGKITASQAFEQVTAPAGQAVPGYPKTLIPAHGSITASYHNQYNGYDQYTLVVSANTPLASEYSAFQQFLAANKFKITSKTTSNTEDTINAQEGIDYATVQLVPSGTAATTVTINYGTPIQK